MATPEKSIDLCKDSPYLSIFQAFIEDAPKIVEFYLYRVAEAKDSPLSLKLDIILNEAQKDALFSLLLSKANTDECKFVFSQFLRNNIEEIRKLELSDNTLNCNCVKGFFQINKKSNQHKLDCMFKRIRDSFAHGRIGVVDDYLILEDKVNELTGRFVVTKDILILWIDVVLIYIKDNNLGQFYQE